jgi:hypothetical protein
VTWPVTPIDDDETLYRRVPEDKLKRAPDGRPLFSARLFRDPECRPSVYRAALGAVPEQAQNQKTDGVLTLTAGAIRGLDSVAQYGSKGEVRQEHVVDIEHRPEGPPGSFDIRARGNFPVAPD